MRKWGSSSLGGRRLWRRHERREGFCTTRYKYAKKIACTVRWGRPIFFSLKKTLELKKIGFKTFIKCPVFLFIIIPYFTLLTFFCFVDLATLRTLYSSSFFLLSFPDYFHGWRRRRRKRRRRRRRRRPRRGWEEGEEGAGEEAVRDGGGAQGEGA